MKSRLAKKIRLRIFRFQNYETNNQPYGKGQQLAAITRMKGVYSRTKSLLKRNVVKEVPKAYRKYKGLLLPDELHDYEE